jgi:hypothetical protein
MATVNTSGKTAYMYDADTDTWYSLAASTNTAANYVWSGTHSFGSNVTFSDINSVVQAKAGVNNFLNPAARDAALTSPVRGTVCFIRQDAASVAINQIQFYDGTAWRPYEGIALLTTNTAVGGGTYTLSLDDISKSLTFNSAATYTVSVPPYSSIAFPIGTKIDILRLGAGAVTISPGSGVTINSKNSNKNIAAQYSGATLVKVDTNTWILIGDLIA